MIDYLDIPMGGEALDRSRELDPDARLAMGRAEIFNRIAGGMATNARLLGSEPICHESFDEAVGLLRVNGCQRIRVQTGGWGLREEKQRLRLFQTGVRLFEVRFFSSEASEHDRLAGMRGSFAVARAALDHVRDAGTRMVGGGPTFLEARIIVAPDNFGAMDRIIARASRWHVHQLAIVRGRTPFPLDIASGKIRIGIEEALKLGRWVYLEGWPACLFLGLELHLRELTRHWGRREDATTCPECPYGSFCPGSPPEFEWKNQQIAVDAPEIQRWQGFYARVIERKGMP